MQSLCPTRSSKRSIGSPSESRSGSATSTPRTCLPLRLPKQPIYRGGERLQPWQRSFVTTFLEHREAYGKARLLLADEVGVGKTLSLAMAAMIASLLDDGPALILCPATLTVQWQIELTDKLGIPSSVWSSTKKLWLDHRGHEIQTRGPGDIVHCPSQIAIVSTGLIIHESSECEHLLEPEMKYGTVILDEAHRARQSGGLGRRGKEPNNLLRFMLDIGPRTRHLVLGTGNSDPDGCARALGSASNSHDGCPFRARAPNVQPLEQSRHGLAACDRKGRGDGW